MSRRRRARSHPALNRVWVRAIIALTAYPAVLIGFVFAGAATVEHGHATLGQAILIFAVLSMFAAVIIGPAWVIQPRTQPPDGGPTRGRVVPIRPAPAQGKTAGADDRAAA